MRIILKYPRLIPITRKLTTLGQFCVCNRFYFAAIVFRNELINGILHEYIDKFILVTNEVHNYTGRSSKYIHIREPTYI